MPSQLSHMISKLLFAARVRAAAIGHRYSLTQIGASFLISVTVAACGANTASTNAQLKVLEAERQARLQNQPSQPEFIPFDQKTKATNPVVVEEKKEPTKDEALREKTNLDQLMAADANTVKIGVVLPLSGPVSEVGKDLRDAALMAFFDLGGDQVQLLVRDSKGTVDGARTGVQELLDEGVKLILGPLLRSNVSAVAELTKPANVPMIAFSSDRKVAQDGVFLLSFTPYQEVKRVVTYAFQKGIERFGVFAPDTEYSRTVVAAMEQILQELGGELLQETYYNPDGSDLQDKAKKFAAFDLRRLAREKRMRALQEKKTARARRLLRQLQREKTFGSTGIQAVMVPDDSTMLVQVAPTLDYYDVDLRDIKLLGTGLWSNPLIVKEPSVQGGWFATPAPEIYQAFADRFEQIYGRKNIRIATLAYDAAALAAVLGQQENGLTLENLTLASGFDGKDGLFRFRADGRAERGLSVVEVGTKEFKVIDPAPSAFTDPGS